MDEGAIVRGWTHAAEEDDGDRMVFRPSDSDALAPSRAPRMSFDLAHGGELTSYAPGPDDRRTSTSGRWRLHGSRLVLEPGDGAVRQYEVDEAGPERLVLRPAG
jgi:hypothetical protein